MADVHRHIYLGSYTSDLKEPEIKNGLHMDAKSQNCLPKSGRL